MKILIIALTLISTSTLFAADRPVRIKGIICTGTKAIKGVKPSLIIKDISNKFATLNLSMDDGLPDIRNATLEKIVENGKLLVAYISEESAFSPNAPRFAVYTNGSTPQNTTKANLSFENSDSEIEMTCRDGMASN